MFNQVAVPPEDQVALRFLWRQSPGSEAEVYQYQRHIFGAKCAPTMHFLEVQKKINCSFQLLPLQQFWIRKAQAESFPQEVATLKKILPISSKSKLVSLSPFLDKEGMVRVGGQIERPNIPYSGRHPLVLSPEHELSRLIVINCHEKLKHEGLGHV